MKPTEQKNGAPSPAEALASIRREIDRVDADLVELIHRRLGLAAATLDVKSHAGVAALDGLREAEVVRAAASRARDRGIDPEPVREIFWRLIELTRRAAPRREATAADATLRTLVDPYDPGAPLDPTE